MYHMMMFEGVCCGLSGIIGFAIELLILVVLVLVIVWLIKQIRK